jgi:hypothetical protein
MLPERPVHLQEIAATEASDFIVGSAATVVEPCFVFLFLGYLFHPKERQRREPYL